MPKDKEVIIKQCFKGRDDIIKTYLYLDKVLDCRLKLTLKYRVEDSMLGQLYLKDEVEVRMITNSETGELVLIRKKEGPITTILNPIKGYTCCTIYAVSRIES